MMGINYDELVDYNEIEIDKEASKIDEIIEYEEILFEISKCIKKYRNENNLTQKQLAKILGFDQVMVSKLESGNYNPTFKQLHKISRKLTNSTELFIETLRGIINNLTQMYSTTFSVKTIADVKSNGKIKHIAELRRYNYDSKGGNSYGPECTSDISIAG